MKLSSIIPFKIRKAILQIHQNWVWKKSIFEFKNRIEKNIVIDDILLRKLVYGWGNQGFSAQVNYLKTCIKYGLSCQLPVLECGSGLTTVLLGIVLNKSNIELYSLENSAPWAGRVKNALDSLNLHHTYLYEGPLKSYGNFTWYDVSELDVKQQFGLIICDGPPAQTNGGRYGLVPIMKEFIDKDTIILMDDTIRQDEMSIIKKWQTLISFTEEYVTEGDHHAILQVTGQL
jgi:hypothetical protein